MRSRDRENPKDRRRNSECRSLFEIFYIQRYSLYFYALQQRKHICVIRRNTQLADSTAGQGIKVRTEALAWHGLSSAARFQTTFTDFLRYFEAILNQRRRLLFFNIIIRITRSPACSTNEARPTVFNSIKPGNEPIFLAAVAPTVQIRREAELTTLNYV